MAMKSPSVKLQNPVGIARIALRNLADAAIPPTPENYAKAYRRAAGIADSAADERETDELVIESAEMLSGVFETIGQTTKGLTVGIERFDSDLKSVFEELDRLDYQGVRRVIEGLTASGLAMQKTIDASRLELDDTRNRLDQVSAELERVRTQAGVDALTGAVNRRAMEEIIGREIARARRTATALALAILDIDHFKNVNDAHGHDVGDRALVHLAQTAKSGLRETDVVCRYGGEEFVLVLPGSTVQGALFVVDRLRVMIEKTPMLVPSGKLQIRFSAGVAELCPDENWEMLLKRADKALYAAKRAGRNRVFCAPAAA
jgi:diguanylate cyclase